MVIGTGAWLALKVYTDEWPADLFGFFVSIAVLWALRNGAPAAIPESRS
jgi:hypothetical protein